MKKKKEIARTVKHKLVLNLEQESKLLEKSFLCKHIKQKRIFSQKSFYVE